MKKLIIVMACLMACTSAMANGIVIRGDGFANGVPPTNWYDIYPDFEATTLFLRFTSADPLTNEAFSVTGGITDPGGGAAAAYSNDMAGYGGNDWTDCGDSFANYYVGTNQNFFGGGWVNKKDVGNRFFFSSQFDSSNGEFLHQQSADGTDSTVALDGMGEGSWGVATNTPADTWVYYMWALDQVPGGNTEATFYINGVRVYAVQLLGEHFFGSAGAKLLVSARPWPASSLAATCVQDDRVFGAYEVGSTNRMDDAKALAWFNVPRSSN